MAKRQCQGETKTGKPCKAAPLTDSDYCIAHSDREVQESTGFGGPQPGAGRPRNPRAVDVLRERLEENIDRVLNPLFDALDAERSVVVGNGPSAHVEVVEDIPTRLKAVSELLDRAYGRPKQAHEVSGADGAPVDVHVSLDERQREALSDVLRGRPATRRD